MLPEWIAHEGLIFAGSWEPLRFRIRRGGSCEGEEKLYEKEVSEGSLDSLASQGVNLVIVPFYKGFGIEHERATMKRARDLVAAAQARGIRVAGYVQFASFHTETMLEEHPAARSWAQVDSLGRPAVYGYQYERHLPCPNNEDFMRYLERVVALACEARLDMIHLDNVFLATEPESCRCENCIDGWREFIAKRYAAPGFRKRRLGLPEESLAHVPPPRFSKWHPADSLRRITSPTLQDWIDFRTSTLERAVARLRKKAKELSPGIVFETNPPLWPNANTSFIFGSWPGRVGRLSDLMWTEEPAGFPRRNARGGAVTRARSFKTARALGARLLVHHPAEGGRGLERSLGEAMAFGMGSLGRAAAFLEGAASRPERRRYIDLFRENRALFLEASPAATVAVYRSYRSLAYDCFYALRETFFCEQALLEARVPFDIVFDLENLRDYPVVILPGCWVADDEELAKLRAFLDAGGGVVASARFGEFDASGRKRERPLPLELLGADSWPARGRKGRFFYIDAVATDADIPPAFPKDPYFAFHQVPVEYWRSPENSEEFLRTVREAHAVPVPVEVKAPSGVLAEFFSREDEMLVHLLNLGDSPVSAELKLPSRVVEARVLSPGGTARAEAEGEVVRLEGLEVYALVRARL